MQHLISAEALTRRAEAVVFDCRFSLLDPDAGRRDFLAAHIPGARYADLERDLSAPPGAGGRHPLPAREALAAKLRDFGVDTNSLVVCYDQNAGAVAGRLWWLLRWLGHAEVAVLDGGLDAWIAAGFEVESAVLEVSRGNFEARQPLTRTCTIADIEAARYKLLDAREASRYRGESEPIDPVAGHIPGAVSVPFADNLAAGRFKSPAALRSRFEELGIGMGDELACYCGSGVTAAHDILALLIAGYPEPALYPGSWSEWITDPARPIATG
jgi:thiosulfate/3-mercaptopyruvate sulfurtransferase